MCQGAELPRGLPSPPHNIHPELEENFFGNMSWRLAGNFFEEPSDVQDGPPEPCETPPPTSDNFYRIKDWLDDLLKGLLNERSGAFILPSVCLNHHSEPIPPRPESTPPLSAKGMSFSRSAIESIHLTQQYSGHAAFAVGADFTGLETPTGQSPSLSPPTQGANHATLTFPPADSFDDLFQERNSPPPATPRQRPSRGWRNQRRPAPSTPSSSEEDVRYIPTPATVHRSYLDRYQRGGPPPSSPSSSESVTEGRYKSMTILNDVDDTPRSTNGSGRITDYPSQVPVTKSRTSLRLFRNTGFSNFENLSNKYPPLLSAHF